MTPGKYQFPKRKPSMDSMLIIPELAGIPLQKTITGENISVLGSLRDAIFGFNVYL
jgi:hypothetical protein